MSACPFHYETFRCLDLRLIEAFIEHFPLACITSVGAEGFASSHIPLFRGDEGVLLGHVDARNPQFHAQRPFSAHVMFQGPSAYIPPEAYESRQLPTWNYLSVHMQAEVSVHADPELALEILQRTAKRFGDTRSNYRVDAQDPRVIRNLPHIRALRIRVLEAEGRFKLSQDKPHEDRNSALTWLWQPPLLPDGLIETLLSPERWQQGGPA